MRNRPPLELRSGMKVRFGPDRRVGEFWVSVIRLEPADEETAAH